MGERIKQNGREMSRGETPRGGGRRGGRWRARTDILQALPPPMSMPPIPMPPMLMPPIASALVLAAAAAAMEDMVGDMVAEAVMDILPMSIFGGLEVVETKGKRSFGKAFNSLVCAREQRPEEVARKNGKTCFDSVSGLVGSHLKWEAARKDL